jgi:hypothetical protein
VLVAGATGVLGRRGTATFSYDAATAVQAALDKGVTGALDVVDDDPAPVAQWAELTTSAPIPMAQKGKP